MVIVKALGALLMVFSCGVIGFLIARNYQMRPRELRALQSAFQILETEIGYSLTSLPQALEKVGNLGSIPIYEIFNSTKELLISGEGYTPAEAWDKALNECFPYVALTVWDMELLSSFGKLLGASERNDQIRCIQALVEELSRECIKAEEEKEKNFKIYMYLGVMGGLCLVLLIY